MGPSIRKLNLIWDYSHLLSYTNKAASKAGGGMTNFSSTDQLKRILRRYLKGKATAEEVQFLDTFNQYLDQKNVAEALTDQELDEIGSHIWKGIDPNTRTATRRLPVYRYAAAAIAIIAIGLTFFLWQPSLRLQQSDMAPGGNKATLMLSNGKVIDLQEAKTGKVAGNFQKINDSTLSYKGTGTEDIAYSKIAIPNGGQYKLVMQDGSCVWLNANSSLEFSTRQLRHRRVVLEGEAYFQVKGNADAPFIIETKGQEIRVLGTEFNVKAYANEQIATTLVSGRVSVSGKGGQPVILKPGQQAISEAQGLKIQQVDLDEYTAWKSGQFIFHGTNLKSIMRQIERWYDIDVDIDKLPDSRFYAEISRDKNLSEVLRMLEKTSGLKFKINKKERRLIVE